MAAGCPGHRRPDPRAGKAEEELIDAARVHLGTADAASEEMSICRARGAVLATRNVKDSRKPE
jgi:hypothetical protein